MLRNACSSDFEDILDNRYRKCVRGGLRDTANEKGFTYFPLSVSVRGTASVTNVSKEVSGVSFLGGR